MIEPGTYKHFKGGEYEVFTTALNRDSGAEVVIYRKLGVNDRRWEFRTVVEFTEEVHKPELEYDGPRFQMIMSNREGP